MPEALSVTQSQESLMANTSVNETEAVKQMSTFSWFCTKLSSYTKFYTVKNNADHEHLSILSYKVKSVPYVSVYLSVSLILMHGHIFLWISTKFGSWNPYIPRMVMGVEFNYSLVQLLNLISFCISIYGFFQQPIPRGTTKRNVLRW